MAGQDDLEPRVSALETDVRSLRSRLAKSEEDAGAARALARGADSDVAEFRTELRDFRRATTSSFNALREDMHDLREHVGGLERRFDVVDAGHQQIVGLLTTLIEQRDENGST